MIFILCCHENEPLIQELMHASLDVVILRLFPYFFAALSITNQMPPSSVILKTRRTYPQPICLDNSHQTNLHG